MSPFRRKVLVVEDDPAMREILASALHSWGYTVEVVSDGTEALKRVRRHPPPNVILLDLLLPTMSGWEVATELSKSDRLSRIPLVIVSAYVTAKASTLPSAAAYLGKPLDLLRLRQVLEEACPVKRRK